MSQVGRIGGHLLDANLVRHGVDLSVETDLLYLDVNNNRVGIKTTPGVYDLDINDTIRATNLDTSAAANIYNIIVDASGVFTTSVGPINLVPNQSSPYITHGQLVTDDLDFNDNYIKTFSNANLELRPNASGTTDLQGTTNITGNLRVYGTYPDQGNISLDGNLSSASNIIVGDSPMDTVEVQTDFTQDIEPGTTLTYDLGTADKRWAELYAVDETTVNNYIPAAVNVSTQLRLDGVINTIYALQSDDDVILDPDTGIVYIETGLAVSPTTGLKFQSLSGTLGLTHTLENPNSFSTTTSDRFGTSVSTSRKYSIVGAYGEDDAGGSNSGKAYIFDVTTGALLHTLDNPNAYSTSSGDYFGYSVSIEGNYAIVGAYQEDDVSGSSQGKAYIFSAETGLLVHTLDNPNPSANDYFGYAVSISNSYAIIGAYGESGFAGKAYIFDVASGTLLHTLTNPNADPTASNDGFGFSVSITDTHAIVGANNEDDGALSSTGKAYIYSTSTGTLLYTLDNPTPSANDNFGYSVSISDSYAVVGAYQDTTNGYTYIYDLATGNLLHSIASPAQSGAFGAQFGYSVSNTDDYTVVGAPYNAIQATNSGRAYIYDTASGSLLYTLDNPDSNPAYDYFSTSVSISGTRITIGSLDSATGIFSGRSFIYSFSDIPTITNLHATDPLVFASTGIGYTKFEGTNGVVIPAGTDAERPANPELGDTRWNTDEEYLECFAGEIENISVAGSIAGVGTQETQISPTITSGGGQDARFNFIIDSGSLTVRILNPGAGYKTGDTITVPGNLLSGGTTPANDLTITVGAQTKDGYTISTGGGETVTVDFMEELIDVYTLMLG